MFCCSIATMLLLFYNYINPALSRKLYGILLAENTLLTDFGNFVFYYFLTILEPFFDPKKWRFHDLISVFGCFFLFVFVMATSHSIRPPTLIFGKFAQCDLEREKKVVFFFSFSFFTILGPIFMFLFSKLTGQSIWHRNLLFVFKGGGSA